MADPKKLLELANLMETATDQPEWDMAQLEANCGCLITFACQMLIDPLGPLETNYCDAMDKLGLTEAEATNLFQPDYVRAGLGDLTRSDLPSLGDKLYSKERAIAALLLMAGGDKAPWETLHRALIASADG